MNLKAETKVKLERSVKILAGEFAAVPRPLIASEVEANAARLLESARFDDYVPILAHRYVRDRLREGLPALALADAA